jgi:hypothetical protein
MSERRRFSAGKSLATLICALSVVVFAGAALAHSPYLLWKTDWVAPDGTQYSIAILFGDGIIVSDPGRPVVLDSAGQVVAMGPLVKNAFVRCRSQSDCIVLLDPWLGWDEGDAEGEAVAPDPSTFRAPRSPHFYPESEQVWYGFKAVPVTVGDRWVLWIVPFHRHPTLATAFGLLFALFGFVSGSMLGPAWRMRLKASSKAARVAVFLTAWPTWTFAAALPPLLLIALVWKIEAGAFTLRLLMVASCIGFLIGLACAYLMTVRPSLTRHAAAPLPSGQQQPQHGT